MQSFDQLDAPFAALADPTRRAILARLASGQASVTELAEPFAMSQPAISKHLKVLEGASLISRGADAPPRVLEAWRRGGAARPDPARPRRAGAAAPARGPAPGRGHQMAGRLPALL